MSSNPIPSANFTSTGDTAVMDEAGYLWYQGRSDDVFKAAGYRIGPSEIENCLVKHPAVANAAVVPKPDAERGAVVKAFVVLAAGFEGDAALVEALQRHVRGQLAPYEYPKEIEFIDALPMTTTLATMTQCQIKTPQPSPTTLRPTSRSRWPVQETTRTEGMPSLSADASASKH